MTEPAVLAAAVSAVHALTLMGLSTDDAITAVEFATLDSDNGMPVLADEIRAACDAAAAGHAPLVHGHWQNIDAAGVDLTCCDQVIHCERPPDFGEDAVIPLAELNRLAAQHAATVRPATKNGSERQAVLGVLTALPPGGELTVDQVQQRLLEAGRDLPLRSVFAELSGLRSDGLAVFTVPDDTGPLRWSATPAGRKT